MQLTEKGLVDLIQNGEKVHFEGKDASRGFPGDVWEPYSSFANTDGGVIVLGLKEVDHKLTIQGVKNSNKLIKEFWDAVNNREKVSANILFDRQVYPLTVDGKDLVVIEVPRAERQDRPVHIGDNVFSGCFRRNGEGDYNCPRESIESMIRDRGTETADGALIVEKSIDDFNAETLKRYREDFKYYHPHSAWIDLPTDEFLVKIGAARRSEHGKVCPTLAGMVCFADFMSIVDVVPNYFLDFRDRLADGGSRWQDRVYSGDPSWSGNIIDFYYRIHDKVTSAVKVPFRLDSRQRRIDNTDVHDAVREVVANALIHADYHGRRGIVIDKVFNRITVSNPGILRISKDVAVEGGTSDPRNARIFNIFSLIDVGERSGMGLNNLCSIFKREGFEAPQMTEDWDPDRTKIVICTASSEEIDKLSERSRTKVAKPDQNPIDARPKPDQNLTKLLPDCLQNESSSVKRVFRAIMDDPKVTYRAMVSMLNLNKDTINEAVAILITKGVIRRVGNKRNGYWDVIE